MFVFDRVFGEDIDQEGVFDYVIDSVNSFVQGYNVSILAYGQSGAGKSYTMGTTGPREQGDADIMGMFGLEEAPGEEGSANCTIRHNSSRSSYVVREARRLQYSRLWVWHTRPVPLIRIWNARLSKQNIRQQELAAQGNLS
jgi:hypothetical protein